MAGSTDKVLGGFAPSARARRDAAFTLIELLIVLMLIALISSLIVPAVAAVSRRGGLDATGQRLAELSRFGSMSAVTRHATVVLNLDADRHRCWVSLATAALPWQKRTDDNAPRTQILETLTLPEGTSLSVTKASVGSPDNATASQQWDTITFRPNGLAEDTSIRLSNPAGEQFSIEVVGVTGEVRTGAEARHGQ